MPRAKPRYDGDGTWKFRTYDEAGWNALDKKVQRQIRSYYPDKDAATEPTFGHPADSWATGLLNAAHTEISMTLWLGRRLTNGMGLFVKMAYPGAFLGAFFEIQKLNTSYINMLYR